MTYYDSWSTDPSQNSQAPPVGAGEGKMAFDLITDTFRVVMAAIKQLANVVTALGNMSAQNSDNVSITGGNITGTTTISSSVSIAAEALKSGLINLARIPNYLTGKTAQYADGMTAELLQTMYNYVYPVGRVMLWHTNDLVGSGLVWPGTIANWVIITAANDYILVGANGIVGPSEGHGTMKFFETRGTTNNGAHSHGGITQDTAITIAQMPAHQHNVPQVSGTGGTEGSGPLGGTGRLTSIEGGGQGHHHGINIENDHGHLFDLANVAVFGVVIIQRIA